MLLHTASAGEDVEVPPGEPGTVSRLTQEPDRGVVIGDALVHHVLGGVGRVHPVSDAG